MAIINCPECKKEISDQAEKCIGCGYPINKPSNESNKFYLENNKIGKDLIIGGGVLFVIFAVLAYSLYRWNPDSTLIYTFGFISLSGLIIYLIGRVKNWYHSK